MTVATTHELERLAVATVKGLAMDGPHAARSGHQGTAMALAPLAHVLWTRVMSYDATDPSWPDRDRLVLSAGHASMLLYSMLHLTGHGLTLDDLRKFRQWDSATPGHPEANHTAGVEVTTGPLGQGLGNAVGMAIAEQHLRTRFGAALCNHHIFTLCGDGDLSEGLSHEAASLAGHLGLGRLIAVYDDNHISIDGPTELSLSDDAPARFRAYGWHVIELGEVAEDLDALEYALRTAMAVEGQPSLLVLRSHIAYPAPTSTDSPAAHGYAIVDDEIAATKALLGLPTDTSFFVPEPVGAYYRQAGARGAEAREAWEARRRDRAVVDDEFESCLTGRPLPGWEAALPRWEPGKNVATRKANGACLEALAPFVPGLIGGGADLTSNTGTTLPGLGVLSTTDRGGRQIYFGVREHAMGAALVGAARHGGVIPFGGTFLVFSDYMRPSVRLAALSRARAIFVWSHDSVAVGEDGPTHQPVEQLLALRAIPGLSLIRPADANETAAAWRAALEHDGPTALILSRQDIPVLAGTADAAVDGVARGAYVLRAVPSPDVVLVGTGSEVSVALEAADLLAAEGVTASVVSMPSWDRFQSLPTADQEAVIPRSRPRVSVEAGTTLGWERFVDVAVGIDRFGASAPGDEVLRRLGITAENVAEHARQLLR